jgi:hypothetical protein
VKDQNGGQCGFTKQDGARCQAHAMDGSGLCFFHDPDLANERTEARRAGGRRNKAAVLPLDASTCCLESIKDGASLLGATINQVRRGELDPRVGNCTGYLAGILLKAIEAESLDERISSLENAIKNRPQRDSPFDTKESGFDTDAAWRNQ